MKTRIIITLLGLICLAVRLHAGEKPPAPLSAALFDVEVTDYGLKEDAAQVGALLDAYLGAEDSLIMVERKQLAAVLGEQAIGSSGMVNAQTAAHIGQLTGAKVLLLSRAFAEGESLTVVTKIIGTETGRVFAQIETLPPGEKRRSATQTLADKIAAVVRKNADDLVAKPESTEDRIARMKKQLTGVKLPAVSISIPEQHLTRRVIDPAAETEIANILGQVGFTLFKPDETAKTDYRIIGEAISEQALRRGDFTSCRARVEIKVVEVATGRIILQDRQIEVAADLAETMAAKSALQKAGAKLAERIAERFATLK